MRIVYSKGVDSVKLKMNETRKKLISSIGNGVRPEVREQVMKEMADAKLQLELRTFQHLDDMRELCNEEQKVKFDSLLVRIVEHAPMFNEGRGGKGKFRRDKEGRGLKE